MPANNETENKKEVVSDELEKEVKKKSEEAKPKKTKVKASEETENLKKENEELKDKLLRTMAEFDNYKKRTAKEKEELMDYSKVLCMKELLSTVDNFERALAVETKDPDYKKGMEMVFNGMQEALKKIGVEEIAAMEKEFDPEVHSAIKQVEDENFGDNIVCEVFQKGYSLNGKVIRHSVVAVANP